MTSDNRNIILAIVLSAIVLIGWQLFIAGPSLERAQRANELAAQQAQSQSAALPAPSVGATAPATVVTREDAIAATPRIPIDTAALLGSINLVGGRLDDLHLKEYRETVDPASPIITLLSPANAPGGYYAEQGFVPAPGATVALPGPETTWTVEGSPMLSEASPLTLIWDNGAGLIFRRTYAVDEHYLFTVTQAVENNTAEPVTLYPYAQVARVGTPRTANFFILHEGPVAVLGDLKEISYGDVANAGTTDLESVGGWLGFTDKYWATAVMPEAGTPIRARYFHSKPQATDLYQSSFASRDPMVAAPGATATNTSYLFAGAKVAGTIDAYQASYGFDRLELLIDWGWFHFITRPMFVLINLLYGLLGNFGLAILAVTVIVKIVFIWFANRSYASMAAMRKVQPEMKALQEKLKDDRLAMQQAMMELYKREKINPLSGCWPILIQIPVFFALYKVLFITIEMRHAPFFGWIQDLAAPDPTNVFTLFGLIAWEPTALPFVGGFLHLGIWPLVMGVTMWLQMKLQPPPPDPTQQMVFNWLPVIFTFMLGSFPAGLVIYWAWNNTLSIAQQAFIMKRHGAEVNLFGNIANGFKRKPKEADKPAN